MICSSVLVLTRMALLVACRSSMRRSSAGACVSVSAFTCSEREKQERTFFHDRFTCVGESSASHSLSCQILGGLHPGGEILLLRKRAVFGGPPLPFGNQRGEDTPFPRVRGFDGGGIWKGRSRYPLGSSPGEEQSDGCPIYRMSYHPVRKKQKKQA
jgi:hypothetical protein